MSNIATEKEFILAQSPLAYWPLDAVDGLTDVTGNGNDGTAAGGITVGTEDGPGDSACTYFDGINGTRITTPLSLTARAGLVTTYAWWSRPDGNASVNTVLGSSSGASSNRWDVDINLNDRFRIFTPGVNRSFAVGDAPVGVLNHYLMVHNDSALVASFYTNGYLDTAATAVLGAITSPGTLQIGARSTVGPWFGAIGHVAVFDGDQSALAHVLWSWGISTAASRAPAFGLPSNANFPSEANLPTGETLGQP